MNFIIKTILGNFFKGVLKSIKWIVIGLILFGMILGWPLGYIIKKRKERKDANYK